MVGYRGTISKMEVNQGNFFNIFPGIDFYTTTIFTVYKPDLLKLIKTRNPCKKNFPGKGFKTKFGQAPVAHF
jgi:hypothetical protein